MFYSRVKGEAESAVAKIGIKCVSISRPSLVLGPREGSRLTERLAKAVAAARSFAMVGRLMKYRPIVAATIARAMLVSHVPTVSLPGHRQACGSLRQARRGRSRAIPDRIGETFSTQRRQSNWEIDLAQCCLVALRQIYDRATVEEKSDGHHRL